MHGGGHRASRALGVVEITPGTKLGPYTIEAPLGRGGQATTWRARDSDGSLVALKHLSLTDAEDWKAIELFEREAKVLEALDHPSVPRFHQSFHLGPECFIAQDLVEGRSLAEALDAGEAFDEAQLKEIAGQVLEVLDWLHTRAPPVIHRDIKLSNLLMRSDGRVMLIDFGAVQRTLTQGPEGGSTVVGTHGYMAPEQLMGRAEPASDLYGFGATLVHLATGRHPGELPTQGLELDFRALSPLSESMNAWLARLTASDPRERPPSAAAALTELRHPPAPPAPPMERVRTGFAVLRRTIPTLALAALLVMAMIATLTKEDREAPPTEGPPVSATETRPSPEVFVDLPVTLGGGSEGLEVTIRTSKLRRAEAGVPRGSYELAITLQNPHERAIVSWRGEASLKSFGKETRLRWMLVDPVHAPLLPQETRLLRLSEWDVPSDLKSVTLSFGAPSFAQRAPGAEAEESLEVTGVPPSLGVLSRVRATEQLGRCDDKRCFDYAFTFVRPTEDWLKLQQRCKSALKLKKGSYNDRNFQVVTTALGELYVEAGDRAAFRVFCPKDATGVSWQLGE